MNLPYGAQAIADLRASRKRPADMVLVSMIGPLHEINPLVMARPERAYDWKFLAGLDVLLVVGTHLEASLVKRAADSILKVNPDYLGIWFADKQDGLNLSWGSYRPKAKAMRTMGAHGRRMFAGIGRASA